MKLREPRAHQKLAMEYAFPKSRIALFMQMRLGKNLVVIRWARHHELDRVLVVAPNDTLYDWRDELLLENVPATDVLVLDGTRIQKLALADEVYQGWCIVNYEALRDIRRRTGADRTGREILGLPWSGIILDESTAIRNAGSLTAKVLMAETGHIMHRALLTGLPNPHSEQDFFAQMTFLNGRFMGYHNFWGWRHRHYYEPDPSRGDYDWMAKPGVKDEIKRAVHKVAFFMDRKRAGVGEIRVREKRHVTMTPRQRVLYKQVEKEFAFGTLETQWAPVKTLWMARIAGGFSPDRENRKCLNPAKINLVLNLLKGELKNEQVVIWFRFNEELFAVARALKKHKISHTFITGGKGKVENHLRKDLFQKGKARVILMQLKMGRFGWDLSAADTEIRYSEDYDYEVFAQSTERIFHLRKSVPLLSISLITRDTVDEDVVATLSDRRVTAQTFNSVLRERLRSAWALRHPGSEVVRPKVRIIYPGDKPTAG